MQTVHVPEVFIYLRKYSWPLHISKDLHMHLPYLHIKPLQIRACIFCTWILLSAILAFSVGLLAFLVVSSEGA